MNALQPATRGEPEALLHERLAPMLLRLQAEMVSHSRFDAAAAALVAGLAHEGGFDRVSLGAARARQLEDRRPLRSRRRGRRQRRDESDRGRNGRGARPGCDGEFPRPPKQHRPRVSRIACSPGRGGASCTVPLVAGGKTVGAVTLRAPRRVFQRRDRAPRTCRLASGARDLPVVARQASDARALREWAAQARERMSAPEKRLARIGAAAAAIFLLACVLVPVDRQVAGRARVEGVVQRVLVAPTRRLHPQRVRRVPATACLPASRSSSLRTRTCSSSGGSGRASSRSSRTDIAGAACARRSRARRESTRARVGSAGPARSVDAKLERARVEAPFDGLVIQGDLRPSIGAPVKQGDVLMTVARTEDFRVVAEIDERDIQPVAVGQRGSIALSALPWSSLPIEVTRITPVSTPVEGSNIFEVEGEASRAIAGPAARLARCGKNHRGQAAAADRVDAAHRRLGAPVAVEPRGLDS